MRANRRLASSIGLLAALGVAGVAMAHGDPEKPLYVAPGGADDGRCDRATAPCASLGYALDRVGKGGQLRLAAGRYAVDDIEDVFHIVSGLVDVQGGYSAIDGFDRAADEPTVLIGVPATYRSALAEKGVQIVSDRKGIDTDRHERTAAMLALNAELNDGIAASPCTGGQAGGLDCAAVDLLGHVPLGDVSAVPGNAADVWGFRDLNSGREYAIVGYGNGTGVFDVTDPTNPREVGFVDGQSTTWRDIKVYQYYDPPSQRYKAYAYVTADSVTEGLFVIDLTELPQRISRAGYQGDFGRAHNVLAASTDYGTGLSLTGSAPTLIVAGSNNGGGRFRAYTLDTPAMPAFAALPGVSGNDYMHDAASMLITDARIDSCPNAGSWCEVLFDFNESTIDIYDVTDVSDPVRLSRTPYASSAYTHSGWPSEDGMTLFVHDELDEQNLGLNTTLRAFSLADLGALPPPSTWNGPTRAIDHNGFVRGNRYYMSNYSRGLTVLDITDPAAPVTVGRIDTYPFSDSASFVGAWGAFPFFDSGTIAISDINSGLYLVADRSLDVPAGRLGFSTASAGTAEGSSAMLVVAREGGSTGAVSVNWQVVPGSAAPDDVVASGILSWSDGDSVDRTIDLGAVADDSDEAMEALRVRLIAPTGGATLSGTTVASVYVNDPGATATVGFDRPVVRASERGYGMAVAVLRRAGTAVGAVSVDYSLSGGDATAGVDFSGAISGTISWPDGDADPRWIEFPIADDGDDEADEYFELTLSSANGASIGANASLRVEIADGDGFNQAPLSNAGASQDVAPGAVVRLDGGGSTDPDGDDLDYAWTQTLGPSVSLAGVDSAVATFTAPTVSSDMLLRFELAVSDPNGLTDTATTSVTVIAAGVSAPDNRSGGGSAFGVLLLLLAGAARAALSRRGAA